MNLVQGSEALGAENIALAPEKNLFHGLIALEVRKEIKNLLDLKYSPPDQSAHRSGEL